jgi:hypothetical protein
MLPIFEGERNDDKTRLYREKYDLKISLSSFLFYRSEIREIINDDILNIK